MLLLSTIFLPALTLMTAAQTTTLSSTTSANPSTTPPPNLPNTISEEQASKIIANLHSYRSSLSNNPTYISALSALESEIPSADLAAIRADPTEYFATATAQSEPYLTLLPSSYQAYFNSIVSVQTSIIHNGATADAATANAGAGWGIVAQPTGRPTQVVGMIAGAAGAVVMAVL